MKNVVISILEQRHISEAAKLITPLYNTMVNEREDIFIRKEENWDEYLTTRLKDNNWIMLVALVSDDVVGVCTAEIKHCGDGKETQPRDIVFIDYIAVNENYRRCGVGTKLLDKVKLYAQNIKAQTVELNVWGFNGSAIKFYESVNMKPKRIIYEYLIDKEK